MPTTRDRPNREDPRQLTQVTRTMTPRAYVNALIPPPRELAQLTDEQLAELAGKIERMQIEHYIATTSPQEATYGGLPKLPTPIYEECRRRIAQKAKHNSVPHAHTSTPTKGDDNNERNERT
jgi:hypothetical protein